METIILAKVIGPIIVAAALGLIFNPKAYKAILADYEKSAGLAYSMGIFVMIFGFIIVLNHNIWEWNAKGIITLMGWGSLVKGAAFMVAPKQIFKLSKKILCCDTTVRIAMVIMLVAGGYLSYVGYYA